MNLEPSAGYTIDENMSISISDICDEMPGGFFIYTADNKEDIIYANKAMLRIFGCAAVEEFKELTGNSFKGIVHPDDYERVTNSINEQIAENPNKLDYVEYRIIRRDGSVRWVQDYGRHAYSEKHGNIFYVFIDDSTDRRAKHINELEKITAELGSTRARKTQFQKAVLNSALTFFEVNLTRDEFISAEKQPSGEGGSDLFEFQQINGKVKYSEYVKYWTKHTDGKTLEGYREFFNADRLIECYNKGEYEQIFESYAVDDHGRNRILQYVIMLDKNELTGDITALSIVKDITDISKKQKLFHLAYSEANAETIANRNFLRNFSRDIRTPLNSIMSFTDIFTYNETDEDMQKYCIEKIRAHSKELFETVKSSMNFLSMEDANEGLGKTECDLNDMLDDVKKSVLADLTGKHIGFMLNKSGIINDYVYTDTVGLEEIIGQLLSCAVSNLPEDGTITLRVSESAGSAEGLGLYRFEIADNIADVPEDFEKKMYELINREGDIEPDIHSKGWGLIVVKNLLDMMKGELTISSEPGVGSRFTVTIELPHAERK